MGLPFVQPIPAGTAIGRKLMSMDTVRFELGETVIHPNCPEWGSGKVKEAQSITHEGRPVQRIRVDFSNAGSKWLNTAMAPLQKKTREADAPKMKIAPSMATSQVSAKAQAEALPDKGWLDALEANRNRGTPELWELPAALTDIMRSPEDRLAQTAEAYRFSHEPGPLFQWAVTQTGLDDPLSRYTRVELEKTYFQYSKLRDDHLFDLCRQLKRENKMHLVKEIAAKAKYRKARELLEKTLRW